MWCPVVIAVLIAVSFAAPLDNPAEPIAPTAASVVPDKPVPVQVPHEDKTPVADVPETKPVLEHQSIPVQETQTDKISISPSQPVQETEKIIDHSQVLNNLNQPDAKPELDNNKNRPPGADNTQPETNVSPPILDHLLNEHPDKPTLQPIQKPGSEEDNEDSDEDLDLFQALGLLALNYELELLEEMELLKKNNRHQSRGHEHSHTNQHYGNSHAYYTPNREDLPCDCKYHGEYVPEFKYGRKY